MLYFNVINYLLAKQLCFFELSIPLNFKLRINIWFHQKSEMELIKIVRRNMRWCWLAMFMWIFLRSHSNTYCAIECRYSGVRALEVISIYVYLFFYPLSTSKLTTTLHYTKHPPSLWSRATDKYWNFTHPIIFPFSFCKSRFFYLHQTNSFRGWIIKTYLVIQIHFHFSSPFIWQLIKPEMIGNVNNSFMNVHKWKKECF